jgi:hypothetical protein
MHVQETQTKTQKPTHNDKEERTRPKHNIKGKEQEQ